MSARRRWRVSIGPLRWTSSTGPCGVETRNTLQHPSALQTKGLSAKLVHALTERYSFEMVGSYALDGTSCRGVFVILTLVRVT